MKNASSYPKKSCISLWKLITSWLSHWIRQNFLIKLQQSNLSRRKYRKVKWVINIFRKVFRNIIKEPPCTTHPYLTFAHLHRNILLFWTTKHSAHQNNSNTSTTFSHIFQVLNFICQKYFSCSSIYFLLFLHTSATL